jgi:hypothetical protein
MIIVYAGLSFLFYKIFPALMKMEDNTVLGALLMAVATAAILQVIELFVIRAYLAWSTAYMGGKTDDTTPIAAACLIFVAAAAATLACLPIAIGFASDLARWSRRHPEEFWIMAAIPPASYAIVKYWELYKGATLVAKQRAQFRAEDEQRQDG